ASNQPLVLCNCDIWITDAGSIYRFRDQRWDAIFLIGDIGDLVVAGFETVSRSNLRRKDVFSDGAPSERNPFPFELGDALNVGVLSHYDVVRAAKERVNGDCRIGNSFLQADQKRRRRSRVDVDGTRDHGVATLAADAEAPP